MREGDSVSGCPPKLMRLSETDLGSILFLDDGTQVSIDVRPARLNQAMSEHGRPPLTELIDSRSLGVFVGQLSMSAEQWDRIRECIRSSAEAADVFSRFPKLWTSFEEPYDSIAGKIHRLYGGLAEFLYTSHPFNFRDDPNRPLPWYRALLSAPGGWLFSTWVHLGTGKVKITADQQAGHYVE
jgi:hypothetical protein